ncbi:hypothetical protein F5B20DRAFT_1845 [Whalleya microplaca]|nr:hypothetical protein F5B20DRAFT_1845 [Whalleya microplaca]
MKILPALVGSMWAARQIEATNTRTITHGKVLSLSHSLIYTLTHPPTIKHNKVGRQEQHEGSTVCQLSQNVTESRPVDQLITRTLPRYLD